jgi:hypothetical protein
MLILSAYANDKKPTAKLGGSRLKGRELVMFLYVKEEINHHFWLCL